MTPKDGTRKRSQEIIACLTGGMSYRKTAAELGISESTVERVARENRDHIIAARSEQARKVVDELVMRRSGVQIPEAAPMLSRDIANR